MSYLSIADLENAKIDVDHLADIAVSDEEMATDRLGHTKRTVTGWGAFLFDEIEGLLAGQGFMPPIAYTTGLSMTNATQTVGYAGQVYAPNLADLPFTTSGTFEAAKFRLIQGVAGVDLASTTNEFLGAGMVGLTDVGGFFSSTKVEQGMQELGDPRGKFQNGGVNVLWYIPPSLWAAIRNYTSTVDLHGYLQTALTAERHLVFPDGLYNTSADLNTRADAPIVSGITRNGAWLKGTTSGITLLKCPYGTNKPLIEKLRFMGSCSYIGVVTPGSGALNGYLIQPTIRSNDFDYDASACLDFDMISGVVEDNVFAGDGSGVAPAAGTSTCIAMRFHSVSNGSSENGTNLNVIRNNRIYFAGSTTQAAVDISGGTGWRIESNDWEGGGMALLADNVQLLEFAGTNWLERNVGHVDKGLIKIRHTLTPVEITGLNVSDNVCHSLIEYSVGETAGLNFHGNLLNLGSSSFPIFDTTSLSASLQPDGSVGFYDNTVIGGNAINKCVSGTDFRRGKNAVRLSGCFRTAGSAVTDFACSDPGATFSYNAPGDVTITASHPLATALMKVVAGGNYDSGFGRVLKVAPGTGLPPTQIRVQCSNSSGTGVHGMADFTVCGS